MKSSQPMFSLKIFITTTILIGIGIFRLFLLVSALLSYILLPFCSFHLNLYKVVLIFLHLLYFLFLLLTNSVLFIWNSFHFTSVSEGCLLLDIDI